MLLLGRDGFVQLHLVQDGMEVVFYRLPMSFIKFKAQPVAPWGFVSSPCQHCLVDFFYVYRPFYVLGISFLGGLGDRIYHGGNATVFYLNGVVFIWKCVMNTRMMEADCSVSVPARLGFARLLGRFVVSAYARYEKAWVVHHSFCRVHPCRTVPSAVGRCVDLLSSHEDDLALRTSLLGVGRLAEQHRDIHSNGIP